MPEKLPTIRVRRQVDPGRPDRASAAARGYDRRWRRWRLMYLRRNPMCEAVGCDQPAGEVDHIAPLACGGTGEEENLQALCRTHHNRKTMTESSGCPRLRIVYGPPGSGKSSFVAGKRQSHELVIDTDGLANTIFGTRWFELAPDARAIVLHVRRELMRAARAFAGKVWLVAVNTGDGTQICTWHESIPCLLSREDCRKQIMRDSRRSSAEKVHDLELLDSPLG